MHRVLYVGIGSPWLRDAGFLVRQNMFLHALAECSDLHLALIDPADPNVASPPPYRCTFSPISFPHAVRESRWVAAARDIFSTLPARLRGFDVRLSRDAVAALRPAQYDAVFAYRCDFAHFAGVIDLPNLLLDIDDPEHLRRRQAELLEHGRLSRRARLELYRLRRFELRAARHAAASFVCQERDRLAFEHPLPIVVPNCVDAPAELPQRAAVTPSILFVGAVENGRTPNADAASWLLNDIWPLVRSQGPQCELRFAGVMCERFRAEAQRAPGVRVLGPVPRVEDELARASLSIAPIRWGTGTRIKILQSMAWGCPVVCTPKGCEGIDVQHGRELLIASDAAGLASACAQMLRDASLQQQLASAAHRLVAGQYDRASRHPALAALLDRLIARASRADHGKRRAA